MRSADHRRTAQRTSRTSTQDSRTSGSAAGNKTGRSARTPGGRAGRAYGRPRCPGVSADEEADPAGLAGRAGHGAVVVEVVGVVEVPPVGGVVFGGEVPGTALGVPTAAAGLAPGQAARRA